MRTVLNLSLHQIEWMRLRLGISGNEALRLLQLYGYLEHISQGGNAVRFRQSIYSKKTGWSRSLLRNDLELLSKHGWLEYKSLPSGTDVRLFPIPFDNDLMESQTPLAEFDGVSHSNGLESHAPTDGVSRSNGMESHTPTYNKPSNNSFNKNSRKKEKPSSSSAEKKNQNQELLDEWNRLKPEAWPKLTIISPSRLRTIKALGGADAFARLLPDLMRGVKAHEFWGKKSITFENFFGTGTTPKGHYAAVIELGHAMADNDQQSDSPARLSHPDFFPPDMDGDLFPKHNRFRDNADRTAREEQARAFYANQANPKNHE